MTTWKDLPQWVRALAWIIYVIKEIAVYAVVITAVLLICTTLSCAVVGMCVVFRFPEGIPATTMAVRFCARCSWRAMIAAGVFLGLGSMGNQVKLRWFLPKP